VLEKVKLCSMERLGPVPVIAAEHLSGKGKFMTSTSDKIKGAANEAMGKAKQAAGSAVNDPKLRAKGAAQEVEGKAQKTVGGAKEEVKKAVDRG
jgi:uncharacterized protein YjbJ (UPF0337 family)